MEKVSFPALKMFIKDGRVMMPKMTFTGETETIEEAAFWVEKKMRELESEEPGADFRFLNEEVKEE